MSPLVQALEMFGQARSESGEMSTDEYGATRWGRRAAGLLIQRPDGRVLLLLRSSEVDEPGTWGIPGGRVEPGESEWEGAQAEAREELGALPPVQKKGQSVYRSGQFSYTTFFVEMSEEAAQAFRPSLNWENDDWGWFAPDDLPDSIHPNLAGTLSAL